LLITRFMVIKRTVATVERTDTAMVARNNAAARCSKVAAIDVVDPSSPAVAAQAALSTRLADVSEDSEYPL
jgi:hypothetical protein